MWGSVFIMNLFIEQCSKDIPAVEEKLKEIGLSEDEIKYLRSALETVIDKMLDKHFDFLYEYSE